MEQVLEHLGEWGSDFVV